MALHAPLSRLTLALAMAVVLVAAAAAPASAQSLPVREPASLDQPEPGFRITPAAALQAAGAVDHVRKERSRAPGLRSRVVVPEYFGDRRYEVIHRRGAGRRARSPSMRCTGAPTMRSWPRW